MARDFGVDRPPTFVVLSAAPGILTATWALIRLSLIASAGSRTGKELAALGVSRANRCPFCVDAHTMLLHAIGDHALAERLAGGERPENEQHARVLAWGEATRVPGAVAGAPYLFFPQHAPPTWARPSPSSSSTGSSQPCSPRTSSRATSSASGRYGVWRAARSPGPSAGKPYRGRRCPCWTRPGPDRPGRPEPPSDRRTRPCVPPRLPARTCSGGTGWPSSTRRSARGADRIRRSRGRSCRPGTSAPGPGWHCSPRWRPIGSPTRTWRPGAHHGTPTINWSVSSPMARSSQLIALRANWALSTPICAFRRTVRADDRE